MHRLKKTKELINNKQVVYHGSLKPGMKVIYPNKCKHSKAYVYASENIPLCVIFGVKRTGENIDFGVGKFGKPYIKEFYDGALEDRFKNRPFYLYKLPKNKFKLETEYIELVSENPVEVLECLEFKNALDFVLDLEKNKQIKIQRYNNCSKRQKKKIDIVFRKKLSMYLDFKTLSQEEYEALDDKSKLGYNIKKQRHDFCYSRFPEIMEELKK